MSRFRSFCFTINNYTDEDVTSLHKLDFKYLIYGREIGAQKGTPHLQGYCQLNKQTRFNQIKKTIPRANFRHAKGDYEANYKYCTKDGDFEEFGTPPKQGDRTDIDSVRQLALDQGMRAVTSSYNLQDIRIAEKFLTYNEQGRDFKPEVIWLWGKPGAGKSRLAREITCDPYTKSTGTKWWDGYDRHEHVIIDDFRDSWWDITYLLGLIDRYPFRVEFKGGYRQFLAKKIVITSVTNPKECYYHAKGEPISQLLRRIDSVTEVGGNSKGPDP